MFRLITFVCLVHISVGSIIRGRILLDGDVKQVDPISTDSDSPVTVDIPVRVVEGRTAVKPQLNNTKLVSWPELVGQEGTYAVQIIKNRTGLTNVIILPEGSAVTMDYRTDRVRVFVNEAGIVTQIPRID